MEIKFYFCCELSAHFTNDDVVLFIYLTSADLGNASRERAFIYMSDVREALTSDRNDMRA